jgi:hypothetical protein
VKKKFLDTDHPMFRPLWVRILVVAAAGAWGVVEIVTGSPFWAMIFLGLAAYAAWAFFMDSGRGGPDPEA